MPGEDQPISDDETLYRRVPVSQNWIRGGKILPEAFQPRRDDTTGLSVFRAKFRKLEDVAKGASKYGYYVLEMRAGDLRTADIEIVPKVDEQVPGHAEIPSLAFQQPETDLSLAHRQRLADDLVTGIHGPFLAE
ncbi:MAG: hypothetical protein ACREHD_09145 [Pirellulales bacterium]